MSADLENNSTNICLYCNKAGVYKYGYCYGQCMGLRQDLQRYNIFYYNIFTLPRETFVDGVCLYELQEVRSRFLDIIDSMAQICNVIFKYQGKLIGGVVRDYFVPKLKHESLQENHQRKVKCTMHEFIPILDLCNIVLEYTTELFISSMDQNPKDIDVWVQNESQAQQILTELINLEYTVFNRDLNRSSPLNSHYRFPVLQYSVFKEDIIIRIDFLISIASPTDDFSVNLLSYDGNKLKCEEFNNDFQLITNAPSDFTVQDIVSQIESRSTYFLPRYFGRGITTQQQYRIKHLSNDKKYTFINWNKDICSL